MYSMTNNNKRRKKMKTVKAEKIETNNISFINIIGGLFIAFAVIDFAMSFAGTNLTSFLGPVSRFSPIIFGLIGSALLNVGKEGN